MTLDISGVERVPLCKGAIRSGVVEVHSRTFVCLFAHPGGAFKAAVGFLAGDVAPVSRKQVRFHRAAINIGAAACTADTASTGVQSKSRGVLYTMGENKIH